MQLWDNAILGLFSHDWSTEAPPSFDVVMEWQDMQTKLWVSVNMFYSLERVRASPPFVCVWH